MRILVIEDEASVSSAVRKGLESEGYAVDVAADGAQGLWYAAENPYDVIVLDIMLPGLNGLEVCSRLRAAGVWTPILMLTARDAEADEASALDLGADDYLSKPFSFVVLLARIRALTRRGAAPRPAVIEIGAMQIDPASRKCLVAGREIALTAREYAVLEYLARHERQVVSKLDVLENVWDYNFDGDPNIVEVYLRRLRSKLPLQEARVKIETVRGAGYRLEETGGP
jgi:two-component system OmpR family response regulator